MAWVIFVTTVPGGQVIVTALPPMSPEVPGPVAQTYAGFTVKRISILAHKFIRLMRVLTCIAIYDLEIEFPILKGTNDGATINCLYGELPGSRENRREEALEVRYIP